MSTMVVRCLLIISAGVSIIANAFTIKQLIEIRLESLKNFVSIPQYPPQACSTLKYVAIADIQYGNTGNHLIEFAHGLWLARRMNATLVVPSSMQDLFSPFDLSALRKHYCYTLDTVPKDIIPVEVSSWEIFFLPIQLHNKKFIPYLPPNMTDAIAHLSLHYLKVYAALWSSPSAEIKAAGEWIIENHLGRTLQYTSIHKRQMEGTCSRLMANLTKPTDFSPDEINTDRPEWKGNLVLDHPLCSMPIDMVLDIMRLRHRYNSTLFVAYDGEGEIASYQRHGAVFSNVLEKAEGQIPTSKASLKFIDMFVAMHGDLFILNPRSTFSWEIYLIRVCLALESVPLMHGVDLYTQRADVIGKDGLWVSWTSVVEAYLSSYLLSKG